MVMLLTVAGCSDGLLGYRHEPLHAADVQTVAVPIFQNRTFYREVEFELTEALVKQIEQETPYKVAAEGRADTIVRGTILSVQPRLLSRGIRTGLAQEVQVLITASFEWKDIRSGEIRRKRSRVVGSGEYIAPRGVGEPVEVAKHEAVSDLSRRIVSILQSDW